MALTKGLQIDIEHWDQHWNIENIDIDIDIVLNSMFQSQYIEKLLNVFNVSMFLNFFHFFPIFLIFLVKKEG